MLVVLILPPHCVSHCYWWQKQFLSSFFMLCFKQEWISHHAQAVDHTYTHISLVQTISSQHFILFLFLERVVFYKSIY